MGKSATFVKVDHVIQETKNLMNIISKVVSTCFDCANKVGDILKIFENFISKFAFQSHFFIRQKEEELFSQKNTEKNSQ